jgi:hypothetical protein
VFTLCYLHDGYNALTNEINHKSFRAGYNYCESGLCSNNKKHIACGNKHRFGSSCSSDVQVVELDEYHKSLILYMHNLHRNTVALGQTPGYAPASRMGVLQWDNELAYLAELNAMSCEIEVS